MNELRAGCCLAGCTLLCVSLIDWIGSGSDDDGPVVAVVCNGTMRHTHGNISCSRPVTRRHSIPGFPVSLPRRCFPPEPGPNSRSLFDSSPVFTFNHPVRPPVCQRHRRQTRHPQYSQRPPSTGKHGEKAVKTYGIGGLKPGSRKHQLPSRKGEKRIDSA